MTFPSNAWYMLGWLDELVDGAMLARTVLDIPVVAFRNRETGSLVALHDRCPHRFVPLSMGVLEPDGIRCAEHGLKFDCEGAGTVPGTREDRGRRICVRSFPVVEAHLGIWLWAGDPPCADPRLIPPLALADAPGSRGVNHVAAHHLLLSERLMMSPGAPFTCREPDDGTVTVESDHGSVCWHGPGAYVVARKSGPNAAHVLTPQNGASTHHFWHAVIDPAAHADDAELRDLAQAPLDRAGRRRVEIMQAGLPDGDPAAMDDLMLPGDVGGTCVRRRIAQMLAAEQGGSVAPAPKSPSPRPRYAPTLTGSISRH